MELISTRLLVYYCHFMYRPHPPPAVHKKNEGESCGITVQCPRYESDHPARCIPQRWGRLASLISLANGVCTLAAAAASS